MRRSRSGRTFAALFAFWFAISLAEPAALHSCAVHTSARGHAHDEVAHSAVGLRHDGSQHHAMHATVSGQRAQKDAPLSGHGTKLCTCIGSCCASSANAAVPGVGVSVEMVAAYPLERRTPTLRARAVTPPPFFLPYANGPPVPATDA